VEDPPHFEVIPLSKNERKRKKRIGHRKNERKVERV
jgi:hypothetical protein